MRGAHELSHIGVAQLDRSASPVLERFMYKRANAKITEIPGASHAVYVSQPGSVADLIKQAATAADTPK